MTEKLAILGSTGSIGMQALEVCENLGIPVAGLAAGGNISLLEEQKWNVITVWECELKKNTLENTVKRVINQIKSFGEITSV